MYVHMYVLIVHPLMFLCQTFLQIVQAILIGWLTTYFVSDVTPTSTRDAYLTAAAIALSVIAISWIHAWAFLWAQEVGECVLCACMCTHCKYMLLTVYTPVGV